MYIGNGLKEKVAGKLKMNVYNKFNCISDNYYSVYEWDNKLIRVYNQIKDIC